MVTWKIKGIFKADAEKVHEEILSIGDTATPQQIVEYAKNENSELHKCFIWDDTIAAQKYRETQAREIVRSIVYIKDPVEPGKPKTTIRAIVSTNEKCGSYAPIQRIVRDEDSYGRLLEAAIRELNAFRKKYAVLSGDLDGLFAEIEKITA